MVCTVDAIIGEECIDTGFHVTTPEAPTVQELLARMVEKGMTHVVLEATSHGLAQKRVACCEFDAAVVTNVTHEHLDYHGNYENYFASKAELIRELVRTVEKPGGSLRLVVFNKDDISYARIQRLLTEDPLKTLKKITYSTGNQADIFSSNIQTTRNGLSFNINLDGGVVNVVSPLMGNYNVSNILAAFGVTVRGLGVSLEKAVQGIAAMPSVAGRMENISLGQEFIAMVDFAHTPNALKVSLQTTRQMTQGRVIVVFGAAGLRDRVKRRMMAEISVELADLSIFTAEDPRTEKVEDILVEMAKSAREKGGVEGKTFLCVSDRGEAIRQAVKMARSGDLVMACGKGHEQSMCFGEVEYPWDDRVAMKAALAERLGIMGEKMPYLPTQD
jgi:UDP-N-acetylmuramoyl-L-alanyl-D-glutamate--2,6-diaminopimelate ligase